LSSLLLLATRDIGFINTHSDSIIVCLDRPWGPVEKAVIDLFLQVIILVPYLEYYYILFYYLFHILSLILKL
jgi:hypothetical protein